MDSQLVLVMGATGQQGRAVTEALLAKNHRVRALVRSSKAESAARLRKLGADPVEGDYDDRGSLELAASGADAIFAMTTPAVGVDVEVRNGLTIAEAAKAAGVSHFVYSSVANADRETGIPHFESKWEVEQHIRSLDLPSTVIGPIAFMNNLLFPWNVDDYKRGTFRQAASMSSRGLSHGHVQPSKPSLMGHDPGRAPPRTHGHGGGRRPVHRSGRSGVRDARRGR